MYSRFAISTATLVSMTLFTISEPVLAQADRKLKYLDFNVNVGGMGPLGTTGDGYSKSILLGGGVVVPISKWFQMDADVDFGFGTTGASRTIRLTDGSTRSTANYQAMVIAGPRFNVPIGNKASIGFGGGAAAVAQNEYGVGRSSLIGNTLYVENIDCGSCSRHGASGAYILLSYMGPTSPKSKLGFTFKYYMLTDDKNRYASWIPRQNQRWLTGALVFNFGI